MISSEKTERIIIFLTMVISILIPILDFLGFLDSVPFLSQRIPTMILLSIGIILLYHLTVSLKNYKKLEIKIEKGINDLKILIKPDKDSQIILNIFRKLWEEKENDIKEFFSQVGQNIVNNDQSSLTSFLKEIGLKFQNGDIFGTKHIEPWDFNLTAINLKGDFIYHVAEKYLHKRIANEFPYSEILKQENGAILWSNYDKSERFWRILPNRHSEYPRLTKLVFRKYENVNAIVVLELHINIADKVPMQILRKIDPKNI